MIVLRRMRRTHRGGSCPPLDLIWACFFRPRRNPVTTRTRHRVQRRSQWLDLCVFRLEQEKQKQETQRINSMRRQGNLLVQMLYFVWKVSFQLMTMRSVMDCGYVGFFIDCMRLWEVSHKHAQGKSFCYCAPFPSRC